MSKTIKKEEMVKKSNQPQNGKSELMGIPKEPNEFLTSLLEQLFKKYGRTDVLTMINYDGLPIFLQRVLLGRMSSSTLLEQLTNRYGFKEVQNDLKWLKELNK